MRWLMLVMLVGCGSNPFSSGREWCWEIRAAEAHYLERCSIEAVRPLANCEKVWDVDASQEQLRACRDALDAAECGSLSDWPEPCPRVWEKVPWN
jgi:hypothetical protein